MDRSIQNQKKQLRALLKKQTSKLYNEATQSNGHISASQLEELSGIEQLIKALDQTESSSVPIHWPMITLLLVTPIIVSILLFARVSSTEIDLDLSLSGVSFRLSHSQVLSGVTRLSSLGVSGLEEIQFPRTEKSESRIFSSKDGTTTAIKLLKDSSNHNESSLTLSPLMLQNGNYVWLQPNEETSSEYSLSIRSPGLNLQADAFGTIEAGLPGSPQEQFTFAIPQSITLRAGKNDVDLTIEPLPFAKGPFLRKLFIDSLSMFHIDEYLDNEQTLVRQVSTVIAGIIYYESLGGLEYKLRSNQVIYFKKLKGYIRAMEIKDGQIAFTFHGTVSGMSTGGEPNRVSLMPCYLEWLKAQHSLSLFWGTTLYFFGLIISLLHWWKTTK